jgi:outer membrane protein TolC
LSIERTVAKVSIGPSDSLPLFNAGRTAAEVWQAEVTCLEASP